MNLYEHFSEVERKILEARAARAAGAAEAEQDGDTLTALLVTLREETYALPIEAITVVSDDPKVIPVPCVPAYVAGIANMRGHIIPVLDLAELLGVPGKSERANILVRAENEDIAVAFQVEAVGEVAALSLAEMDPIPDILDVAKTEYLGGTFPNGVIMLDIAAILNDRTLDVNDVEE